jgi:hypothetical protein
VTSIPVERQDAGPEPVYVEVRRDCHFKAKPCRACGRPESAHQKGRPITTVDGGIVCDGLQRQRGCERCGRNKGDVAHFGAPPSYNAIGGGRGTGAAAMVGANLKQTWEGIFREALAKTALPKGLARVVVEGTIVFPTHGRRDQGNFRVVIEKALGDALVAGGWLSDDRWEMYEFGQLAMEVVPDVSATRLAIFPMTDRGPIKGEQMGLV